ncbi:MAG: peptide chain release factor 1 [Humidesulfovibrio sp.]|nr:peptide chain release factor 1 [Humidesulfovibrio sp.]
MFAKLEEIEYSFLDLEKELGAPEVLADKDRYRKVAKSHADLGAIVRAFREYKQLSQELADNRELLKDADPEMRELAESEAEGLKARIEQLDVDLKLMLLPKDPLDDKNSILEIRAGTGGDEAALFAADLFRMYSRYAERIGWRVELLDASPTDTGGYKEVIASISGDRVFSKLKWEAGVHRVQRVPATEAQGRIHTSAVTVAIMPEAEEVDVDIRTEDLRIDVYRASGAGGQHVNRTESAVRITHLPSGLVVQCQDEKSQHKNKASAMKVLRSRLLAQMQEKAKAVETDIRRAQVGSGDRSERIRTYNFPQSRVTDHRINLTLYKLDAVMAGDIAELVQGLTSHYQTESLKQQASGG